MITPFLEGEQSGRFKRVVRISLIGLAAIGIGGIVHARAQDYAVGCTEESKNKIEDKRRAKLSGRIGLTPSEIANIDSKCRSKYYWSIIGF